MYLLEEKMPAFYGIFFSQKISCIIVKNYYTASYRNKNFTSYLIKMTTLTLHQSFEDIKHLQGDLEFWLARELMPLL
jgi:hypothetical protein